MNDFSNEDIEIRYSSDQWGPFNFDFTDLLTVSTEIIASVTVRAFVGNVKPGSDLTAFTEITDDLIDADEVPVVVDDTTVDVVFEYPGSDYANQKATLIFEITTDNGREHPFFFQYVRIK